MFSQIGPIVAPVFITAFIGWIWGRKEWPFDTKIVTVLVMYIGTPFLLLKTFDRARPDPEAFVEIAGAALLGYLIVGLTGFAILKLSRLDYRDYLPGLIFSNAGNMGLPITLFAFGDAGLALAIVIFTFSAIGGFTVGIGIYNGGVDGKGLLRMPLIYATLVAISMVVLDLRLPVWLSNTAEILGGLTIPLMLLALGVSLSRLQVSGLSRAFLLSCLRIGGGIGAALLAAHLLGLEGLARNVLILQFAMPVAVYNYLFAERCGRNSSEVAGMVVVSTLLSVLTLPTLLLWLLGK